MKLKSYIVIGYLVSTILTILVVFWAVQRMLIDQKEIYFLVGMTLVASFIGAWVSLFLLSPVFSSLHHLKKQAKKVASRDFSGETNIKGPTEFQELGQAFNDMSHDLQSTFESLDQSEKEKGIMIAQLAHDIKTPITSIQATVEGILDGVIQEEERVHYLMTISRQTDRLNKLVEELGALTLNTQSEIESPRGIEPVFLDQLLIEAMSEFQLLIEKEERDVYIQVSPEYARIQVDYDKISRILVNLLNNAFKYSEPGTKIEVVAQIEDQNLTISVRDEGYGIAPEELDNIFKRLYRVEASRNMNTGGHGLGLAIARDLARQLGGDISVESQYGLGSKFTLSLNLNEK